MSEEFIRTELLLGTRSMEKLDSCRIAVFGVGGVGGHVCEALARSGIGHFLLVDNDRVSLSNINRQIVATHRTVGQYKTDVMKERILDINPTAEVETRCTFLLPENIHEFDLSRFDYVVDAIDTVAAKLILAQTCYEQKIPVISSMGAGNKLDPGRFRITDISKTTMDPLARVMRKELRARGVHSLKVIWSDEPALTPLPLLPRDPGVRRVTPGSTAFVPSVAGLMVAGEVIRDLTEGIRPKRAE